MLIDRHTEKYQQKMPGKPDISFTYVAPPSRYKPYTNLPEQVGALLAAYRSPTAGGTPGGMQAASQSQAPL